MGQVVITYDEPDFTAAREIARGLEIAGYFTWYRWRDGCVGPSFVGQCERRIAEAGAVIPIISDSMASVGSAWLESDIGTARESGKRFIVVLSNIAEQDVRRLRPDWAEAFSTSTTIRIQPEGVQAAVQNLTAELGRLGIEPMRDTSLPAGLAGKINRHRLPAVVDVLDAICDYDLARIIPREAALKHRAVPLECVGNVVVVATSDPSCIVEVQERYFSCCYGIEPVLATEEAIIEAIERVHSGNGYDALIKPFESDEEK